MFIRLFLLLFLLASTSPVYAKKNQTHLEASDWQELTSYTQMMDYLAPLVDTSPLVKMMPMGHSVSGRSIPALYFSQDSAFASQRDKKPLVMISAQQHGDEPSGKEAALIVTRMLLGEHSHLLENLDLILVPQVNPDGSERGTRRNANDMDLNRNHVILTEPESLALHQLFLEWMPEVTLDIHEYNAIKEPWIKAGYVKDADEMLGGVTNLNVDASIIRFTRDTFIPATGKGIEEDGFSFHRYIVGDPFQSKVVRFSTTAINDSRQSMGIYNTLSFIIEGKRYANTTNELQKRTQGQVSAILNFLETSNTHAKDILSIVHQARRNMADVKYSQLQMEYYEDADNPVLNFPVFDLNTWSHTYRVLDFFKPLVKTKKSVLKPAAYVFPASEDRLIALLNRHEIPMMRLKSETRSRTESYHIKHIVEGIDEEKPTFIIDLDKQTQEETLEAGVVVVPVQGAAANLLPVLLEPESTWGVVSPRATGEHRFASYLAEGATYPIKRLVSLDNLDLEHMED